MADRAATPPIPGLLTGFVTPSVIPLTVAYFTNATQLTRVSFRVTDAPSGGTVTVQLNTASDGSGVGLSATIADGENFATATGSASIPAGGYLYQRITAESGDAMNLSGEYEITDAAGATIYLTTLAQVKLDAKISGDDADRDAVLNQLIQGVSKQMQNWMGRQIIQSTATNEKQSGLNGSSEIYTENFPIISITTLTESDTALVEDTDFECLEADQPMGRIVRISGTTPISWLAGNRNIVLTYVHGYAAVPDDLISAATAQVVNRFHETKLGGGWRGLASKSVDPNATTSYDKNLWERETIPAMQPYRRLRA